MHFFVELCHYFLRINIMELESTMKVEFFMHKIGFLIEKSYLLWYNELTKSPKRRILKELFEQKMAKKAYVLIFNNSAGKCVSEKIALKVENLLLMKKQKCLVLDCDNKEKIMEAYYSLRDDDYSVVFVVFGGDGTLSVFVNFALKNNLDGKICVYPSGTANDFATFLHSPKKLEKFVEMALKEEIIVTDVAKVNNTYCINAIGSGNFSNGCTTYTSISKRRFGKLGYYFKCVWLSFRLRPAKLNLTINSQNYSGEYLFFYCVNSKTAGGFRLFAPLAELNDNAFDFIGVKKCGFFAFWGLVFKILFGKHLNDKNIIYVKTKNFKLSIEDKNTQFEKCDIDGNSINNKNIEMAVIPQKLKFIYNKRK